MADIIIAFFVCFTIVACCFFWFNKSELHIHNHHHYYDVENKHPIMATSAGNDGESKPGNIPVGSRNRSASGNEESAASKSQKLILVRKTKPMK